MAATCFHPSRLAAQRGEHLSMIADGGHGARAPLPTLQFRASRATSLADTGGRAHRVRRRLLVSDGLQVCFAVTNLARYSITSSARASNGGGIVNPSILALLRLMTNSIFTDC